MQAVLGARKKPAEKNLACEQAPSWRIKHSKNSARSPGQ